MTGSFSADTPAFQLVARVRVQILVWLVANEVLGEAARWDYWELVRWIYRFDRAAPRLEGASSPYISDRGAGRVVTRGWCSVVRPWILIIRIRIYLRWKCLGWHFNLLAWPGRGRRVIVPLHICIRNSHRFEGHLSNLLELGRSYEFCKTSCYIWRSMILWVWTIKCLSPCGHEGLWIWVWTIYWLSSLLILKVQRYCGFGASFYP